MTDHICKPAVDLTFLRSGIIDALGIRGDVGRDMSNVDLIAAVRQLRYGRDDARALFAAAIDAGIGGDDG